MVIRSAESCVEHVKALNGESSPVRQYHWGWESRVIMLVKQRALKEVGTFSYFSSNFNSNV